MRASVTGAPAAGAPLLWPAPAAATLAGLAGMAGAPPLPPRSRTTLAGASGTSDGCTPGTTDPFSGRQGASPFTAAATDAAPPASASAGLALSGPPAACLGTSCCLGCSRRACRSASPASAARLPDCAATAPAYMPASTRRYGGAQECGKRQGTRKYLLQHFGATFQRGSCAGRRRGCAGPSAGQQRARVRRAGRRLSQPRAPRLRLRRCRASCCVRVPRRRSAAHSPARVGCWRQGSLITAPLQPHTGCLAKWLQA